MQNKHLGEKLEGRKPFVGSRRTDRLHDEQDPFSLKTNQIMEAVVEAPNLRRALAQVKSNKGSAGVDKMTVEELPRKTLTAILAYEGRPPSYSEVSLTIPIRLAGDDSYLDLLMLDASGEAGV